MKGRGARVDRCWCMCKTLSLPVITLSPCYRGSEVAGAAIGGGSGGAAGCGAALAIYAARLLGAGGCGFAAAPSASLLRCSEEGLAPPLIPPKQRLRETGDSA